MNEEIRVPEVRVIGANGEQVGVMSPKSAMELAEQAELDLVEISPNATPPVCRWMPGMAAVAKQTGCSGF